MATVSSSGVSQKAFDDAICKLGAYVAIPSVSNPHSPDHSMESLQAAADFASNQLEELKFNVRQVSIDGSAPFVLAEKITDVTRPTILCYAHYDVQPVVREKWLTDPFVLTQRDGRLYGRGSSDDKGGIIGIITALGEYQKNHGALPFNVKILFEGEEEYGSTHMEALMKQEGDRLKADALVILDGSNLDVNTGTLTTSTRGVMNFKLEVQTMEKPIHSGVGCLAPDPSQIMAELMVSVKDPRKIPGFMDGCDPLKPIERELLAQSSQTAQAYAKDHGLLPSVELRGDPGVSVYERIAEEPSISFVNGAWGIPNGGNSIQESASCEMGVRLTPGQNPDAVGEALRAHLLSQQVQGAQVTLTQQEGSFAWKGDLSRPLTQKYLAALAENFPHTHVQPCGGALPFLRNFQEAFPNMEMIIPGVEDPACAAHSHNESQDIGLFRRAIDSLYTFFRKVGEG